MSLEKRATYSAFEMHLHWTAMPCKETLSSVYVLKPGKLILCKADPFPAPCFITGLVLCLLPPALFIYLSII